MTRRIMLLPDSVFSGQLPFLPPGMLEDLLAIGKVRTDRLDRLATELDQQAGIPNAQHLEEMVVRHVEDSSLTKSVLNTLVNLRADRMEETIRTLRRWREASTPNAARLSEETLETIRDRLFRLIRDYPALIRYRKAQRLTTLTGRMAESVEIICDLRPVFDQTRMVVEGVLPITTLRVVYQNNEESNSLEVLLSIDDLESLAKEVERAKLKLQSLSEHVERWLPHGWVEPE